MKRLTQGNCNMYNGLEFQNVLHCLERVSDQCSDLAVYMLGRTDSDINGREHQYIHNLHHSNNEAYLSAFNSYYDKYFSLLDSIGTSEQLSLFDAYPDMKAPE